MKAENDNWRYFQFNKNEGSPIYVALSPLLAHSAVIDALKSCHFFDISPKEYDEAKSQQAQNKAWRVLKINPASARVRLQIGLYSELDSYGHEGMTFGQGYSLYRYRGVGLLMSSFVSREWELGLIPIEAREDEEIHYQLKTILHRYLGWALSAVGVVGFWGQLAPRGAIIMGQKEAQAAALYFDTKNQKIISSSGQQSLNSLFQLVRLDSTMHNRSYRMTPEELLSFLHTRSTFYDPRGLSVPVRQAIQVLSQMLVGMVYPRDQVPVKTDLSL